MGCSITGGSQNAPHGLVGRAAQVICDCGSPFVTELLVLGLGPGAGGITGDLDHVVLGRLGVGGELVQGFFVICRQGGLVWIEKEAGFAYGLIFAEYRYTLVADGYR